MAVTLKPGDKALLTETCNGGGVVPVRVLKVVECTFGPSVQIRPRKRSAPSWWVPPYCLTKQGDDTSADK